jgi:glutamate--cysteine ligase
VSDSIDSSSSTRFLNAVSERPELLTFNRGIEREALRVTGAGHLAATPHPEFLGSKLTDPKITTDFSESQLELITPVHTTPEAALEDLLDIHRYIYSGLNDELLWSASMPCVLRDNDAIPLAYYGDSNLGRLKTTYRNGLGNRYGRGMQTICAVHYNFSFPETFWIWLKEVEGSSESLMDFQTRRYFDLMRNFRRWSWLLTYLFGASPAVCNSFLKGLDHSLETLDDGTAYLPYATSLRSGNLGYQSDAQSKNMKVCFNSLDSYIGSLADAICTEYGPYKEIGTYVDGEYRQVNANILQSEAEFYSSVRAKRVPGSGENFLACLSEKGVQYIEVRLLDVNPYLPLGIDAEEIRFLDTFLFYCLIQDSPEHDDDLCNETSTNAMATVHEGRSPDLMLSDRGQPRSLSEWGSQILAAMAPVAQMLDQMEDSNAYSDSLRCQQSKISDAGNTPSGAILSDLSIEKVSFFRFAMDRALDHRAWFQSQPLTQQEQSGFDALSVDSLKRQAAIEAADDLSFDDYLRKIASEYLPLRTHR